MKIVKHNFIRIISSAALIFSIMPVLLSCENDSHNTESYDYCTIDEINQFIINVNTSYPEITAVETIGKSVDGKDINALVISSYSGSSTGPSSLEMEPRVRISGGIHGNEKITTEVLIRFINYLVSSYSSDTEIRDLVDSRYIVIIPVINPDGYAKGSRYNSNRVDLNRNFSRGWSNEYTVYGTIAFSEPESDAVSRYTILKRFTTGITLHSGEVIVNMPFDYTTTLPLEDYLVQEFGYAYSRTGSFLSNPDMLSVFDEYNNNLVIDGTIFGAFWYKAPGTLQDWSYLDAGCLDYTVEIAENKYPVSREYIEETYSYNRDSLTAFIKKSGCGVYGTVTDSSSAPVADVKITLSSGDGDLVVYTDSQGYYHRLLLAGTYSLNFDYSGSIKTEVITVTGSDSGTPHNVRLN